METSQFSKNSHISQKSLHAHMRWFFRQLKKGIFHKTAMEKFSAFKGHMAYVKSHKIILQNSITSKKHLICGRSLI